MKIDAHDIELFAKNTGSLYPIHIRMAREHADLKSWFDHVNNLVMPTYRDDVAGYATARTADCWMAAHELSNYYQRCVEEMNRFDKSDKAEAARYALIEAADHLVAWIDGDKDFLKDNAEQFTVNGVTWAQFQEILVGNVRAALADARQ